MSQIVATVAAPAQSADRNRLAILGLIAAALVWQLYLVITQLINGDEFFFLARIYEYERGELTAMSQTPYVHLFTWLTLLAGNEIDQIVAGRFVMLVFEIGTLALIYAVARVFAARDAALLAVFSYVSFRYVLLQGADFRADPLAAFLLMAGLALLVPPRLTWLRAVAAGLAAGLAGLVTVKASVYAPVFLGAALLQLADLERRRANLAKLFTSAVVAIATFVLLFLLHGKTLTTAQGVAGPGLGMPSSVLSDMFGLHAFLANWPIVVDVIAANGLNIAAIILGIVAAVRNSAGRFAGSHWLSKVLFAFPLATVLFYHNSYIYYYAFVLPPATMLAAIGFDSITRPLIRRALVLGMIVTLGIHVVTTALPPSSSAPETQSSQGMQRITLNAMHRIFGQQVSYIDCCSMVGEYRHVGFFITYWALEIYKRAGQPTLREAIEQHHPVAVVANSPSIRDALVPGSATITPDLQLIGEDARALHDNYIEHWGLIWVAGKRIVGVSADAPRQFPVLIPGRYTVEGALTVVIDDRPYAPGDVVTLSAGTHVLRGTNSQPTTVTMRWGDHLPRPAAPPPGTS